MILRDSRKDEFGRNSASPPILRRSEEAANIKQENPNRATVVNGSTWTGFFPSSSHLTITFTASTCLIWRSRLGLAGRPLTSWRHGRPVSSPCIGFLGVRRLLLLSRI